MQFPILQYLDVVIGLAVVMIVTATFVMAVTQFIMSATYARSRHLRDGLHTLLAQLDPGKLGDHAQYLAELVQRDEIVGSKKLFPWFTRVRNWLTRRWSKRDAAAGIGPKTLPAVSPASVIQREELVLLLLQLMGQAPEKSPKNAKEVALKQLLDAVQGQTSLNVAEKLKEIQKEILNQEALHPKAASATWRGAAIYVVALKTTELHDFVAKVNAWYDNAMERVTANFALEAKVATTVVAFFACAWLQLDTIALVKRLSTDENYRNAIVSQAKDLGVVAQDPQTTPAQNAAASDQDKNIPCGGLSVEDCRKLVVQKLADVRELSLVPAKTGISIETVEWDLFGWGWPKLPFKPVFPVSPKNWPWPGLLLSWVLVSLGAPFWYDILKNVMGFRSSLAKKDDKDRDDRRGEQKEPSKKPA